MATPGGSPARLDHVVIWLDKNMGQPENNMADRNLLDNGANVNDTPERRLADEIDRLILRVDPELNEDRFNRLIKSPLRMFVDENECLKYINDTIEAGKQPFLITSGQLGAVIVPVVHKMLSGKIYVFCAQMDLHDKWAKDYRKDIEMRDDTRGVFAKVLLDIGIYYLIKGQNETSNRTAAVQYFKWARALFTRATRIDNVNRDDYHQCVHDELEELGALGGNNNDDDEYVGEDAVEVDMV